MIGASLPPATITSARPSRIVPTASPIAIEDAAQAVVTVLDGPRKPYSIETIAAPMFGISIVIQSGLMRSMPLAKRCSWARSSVCRPPMPVATAVPVRSPSPSAVTSRPESSIASRAATSTNWQ